MVLSNESYVPSVETSSRAQHSGLVITTAIAVDRSDRHPVHQTPGVVRQNFNEEVDQYERADNHCRFGNPYIG
jgi:hypothetical protein